MKKEKAAKKLPHFEHGIEKRPSEVHARTSFGHWEFDSVIGTQEKGYTLLSFTERKTRMQLVIRSKDTTAASTVAALNGIDVIGRMAEWQKKGWRICPSSANTAVYGVKDGKVTYDENAITNCVYSRYKGEGTGIREDKVQDGAKAFTFMLVDEIKKWIIKD